MKKVMIRTLLATILVVFLLFLNIVYGQYTFSFSNNITKYLQQKFEYGKEQGLFEYFLLIFSTAGDAIVTNILGILIWFKASNKEQILKLYTMNAIASSIGNIVKMISAQPRPFYIDDAVKLDFCYTGYGDPSGHSLRPFVFYVLLLETIIMQKFKFEDKYELVQNQLPQNSGQLRELQVPVSCSDQFKALYPNSPISLRQCQIFLGIFLFLIGIGRLYFGVHFLNQIVIGWVLALYLLYLYYYCELEQLIHKIYIEAKRIKDESACTQFTKYIKISSMLLCIYLITFVICYLRHYSTQILESKEEWKQYILKQETCLHKGHYSYEKKFETSDVQYISIIFFPLYLFILYKDQNQNLQYCESPIKLWLCKTNIIKLSLYFILYMIQGKQRIITKLFEKGVPRLMITLLFEQVYYISYALLLLVLIPFITDVAKTILFKLRKSRIAQIEDIESEP